MALVPDTAPGAGGAVALARRGTWPTWTRRPPRGRRPSSASRLPRRPAVPALLRPADRRPRRDDRPARRRRAPSWPRPLLPRLLTAERELTCDEGTDPQDAVARVRRRLRRVGADALPGPGHHVRVLAGRLRHGLPVLRHRPGRADPQPVHRRDRDPGRRRRRGRWPAGEVPGGPGPGLQRGVHGHGRAAGQLRQRAGRGAPDHRPGPRRARASPSGRSPSPPSGLVPAIRRLAAEGLPSGSRCPCTPPTTSCATSWSRSTGAGRSPRCWTRPGTTPPRPAAGCPSSTRMIRDVNDQAWRAEALADLLAGRLAHVNLIPLNPTPGSRWTASDPGVAAEFDERLAARGVPVTVRDTRGTRDRRRLRPARAGPARARASAQAGAGRRRLRRCRPAAAGTVVGHVLEAGAWPAAPGGRRGADPARLALRRAGRAHHRADRRRPQVRRVRGRVADRVPGRRRSTASAGSRSAAAPCSPANVTLCAGMVPGHDLGPSPVLRVGDRCVIGRGSHIVAHHSI